MVEYFFNSFYFDLLYYGDEEREIGNWIKFVLTGIRFQILPPDRAEFNRIIPHVLTIYMEREKGTLLLLLVYRL